MEKRRITLHEIAKLAGVTIGTVDRAIHNRPGISKKTREKVLAIVEEYDYRADIIGRSLSKRKKVTKVGVLIRRAPSFFWDHMRRGLLACERELSIFGLQIHIMQVELDDVEDKRAYEEYRKKIFSLMESDVEALIVVPTRGPKCREDIDAAVDRGLHVVTLNDDVPNSKRLFHIGPNERQMGCVAARMAGDQLPHDANILLYTADYGMYGYYIRRDGFLETMHQDYPTIRVTVYDRLLDFKSAASVGRAIDESKYDAIVNLDGATCVAMADALGKQPIGRSMLYIGFEINKEVKRHLGNGTIHAVISQDAYSQGYFSLRMLYRYLNFKTMPPHDSMFVRTDIILKENMIINDRIVNPYFMGE